MNLILLEPQDYVAENRVVLTDRRSTHAREVLGVAQGDPLVVGLLGGRIGRGRVVRLEGGALELEVQLARDPPPPVSATICVAMSRPPTVRKVLRHVTALGVKQIVLFQSKRVEKSYWSSSLMKADTIEHELRLALEQACDTMLPKITHARRFRPFVEDFLAAQARDGASVLVADAESETPMPHAVSGPLVLVIGPEGGFIPFERALLAERYPMRSLGARVLRVEAATVAALGRLLP